MITLNDYLYDGDTIINIIHNYADDLHKEALYTGNPIDLTHSVILLQMSDFLEQKNFLTKQSQRIQEFYKYMIESYPNLEFTFKGRIKSLIRSESKFNGVIVSYIYNYYKKYKSYPSVINIQDKLFSVRDLLAYRIVISMPGSNKYNKEKEIEYLYEIANKLPSFLKERGFIPQIAKNHNNKKKSPLMNKEICPYYKDYIENTERSGYQSLHITFLDCITRYYFEVQLRTYDMDNYAEIGPANHMGYELRQKEERAKRDAIPKGDCIFFDDAYERIAKIQQLKLNEINVNMFSAVDNSLINDSCGLFRGRLILPFEHLARFQN